MKERIPAFIALLILALVILKLAGVIFISWFWVFAPFLLPLLSLWIVILAIVLFGKEKEGTQ